MSLRFQFFLFSILCSGIFVTGEVWPAEILRFEVPGSYSVECYVITVLWVVTYLTFVGRQTRVLGENNALISELQELSPRAFLETEK